MRRHVRNNRGAMPLWAKIVLGIVIVGFVGILALCIGGYLLFKNSMATEPAQVSSMVKEVMTISEPLPGGWTWQMGMNLQVVKMFVAQAPDQQALILVTMNQAEKTAKELMGDPRITNQSRTRMTEVEKTGTETVAGLPMEYQLGTIEKDGTTSKGFIGAVVDKSANKSMVIVGVQPSGDYNLTQTQQFLKAINKF